MYNTPIDNEEIEMAIFEDKIINNSYNTGEIEYESFIGTIKIDDRMSSFYEDQFSDNMTEIRIIKDLNETIYQIFEESPYFEKYKTPRRVDKADIIKMYYYFKNLLIKKNIYSASQIFIGFAEFFQVNYDLLYNEVGISDKETLLKELHNHNGIKIITKTKKLF